MLEPAIQIAATVRFMIVTKATLATTDRHGDARTHLRMAILALATLIAPKRRPRAWPWRPADARAATDATSSVAVLRLIQKHKRWHYGRRSPLVQARFIAAVQASRTADYQITATRPPQLAASCIVLNYRRDVCLWLKASAY